MGQKLEKRGKMIDEWENLEKYIKQAKCVSFDGCHKIYLALDKKEAEWFKANYRGDYYETVTGSSEEMLKTVRGWFGKSCDLRFISGVKAGKYIQIVAQR